MEDAATLPDSHVLQLQLERPACFVKPRSRVYVFLVFTMTVGCLIPIRLPVKKEVPSTMRMPFNDFLSLYVTWFGQFLFANWP